MPFDTLVLGENLDPLGQKNGSGPPKPQGLAKECYLTPLAVVDRLAECMADERNWLRNSFGYITAGPHCIYGHLNVIDHGRADWWCNNPFSFRHAAARSVHLHIVRRTTPLLDRLIGADRDEYSGVHFNDGASHRRMVRLIAKLRNDILAEQEHQEKVTP